MRRTRRLLPLALCLAFVIPAHATVGEKVDAAGKAASEAVGKAQKAVVKGAKTAASAVARGAHAAGSAVDKAAKKIGVPGAGASAPKSNQNQN
jgi:hypothetical protein